MNIQGSKENSLITPMDRIVKLREVCKILGLEFSKESVDILLRMLEQGISPESLARIIEEIISEKS